MYDLAASFKNNFDQKLQGVNLRLPSTEPVVTEFDKLRKRVAYLNKNMDGTAANLAPSEMQIHQKFLDDDDQMRQKRHRDKKIK